MGDPPRIDLTVLVEAFGVAAASNYVERQLIPHFVAGGVRVEGSSGDALQRARLDILAEGSLAVQDLSNVLLELPGDLPSGGQDWTPLDK